MASLASAGLDALERELDTEEFSLLQAPSSSSGLSSTRSSVRGESVFTPSAARAVFTRNSGGGDGDGPAASRVPMVFTSDLNLEQCCLGIVGASDRFCLALKVEGKTHCGVDAHSKEKFVPLPDHVYPPGGSVSGRPTARFDTFAIVSKLSPEKAREFSSGRFTPRAASHAIIDAATPVPATLEETMAEYERATADVGAEQVEPKVKTEDWSDFSVLGGSDYETGSVDGEQWGEDDELAGDDKSWGPTTRLHNLRLQVLQGLVGAVGRGVPRVVSKINGDVKSSIKSAFGEITSLKQDKEDLQAVLGDLMGVVADQGDLAGTVSFLLSKSVVLEGEVNNSTVKIEELLDAVFTANSNLEVQTQRLLKVISKVSRNCSTKISLMESRVKAVENARLRIDTTRSPTAAGHRMEPSADEVMDAMLNGPDLMDNRGSPQATTGVDGDTIFGQAQLGGHQVDLTMNSLYALVQNLDVQQKVLLDRTKSKGMIFKELAFASEEEFNRFYSEANVTGRGLAAYVDLVSVWCYTSPEQVSTPDWLQNLHRSMATGFTSSIETQYVNSMRNRYPIPFVGAATSVSATHSLKMFDSVEDWRGHGIGDGTKDRLLQFLRLGITSHRTYVLDNVPQGPLRDHALKSAEYTLDFFQALVVHLDDEMNMLLSLKVPEKQIMLLLSNQVMQICEELFEIRQHAANVDTSNKVATASRFAWVTLLSLVKMDEYLKAKFKHHAAITGTFIRFITRQMAQASAAGLAAKITSLETSVRELKNKSASKDVVSKIDNKLESVIRANDLKKNG